MKPYVKPGSTRPNISIHPKSVFKGIGSGECTRFYNKEAVTRLTDVEQLMQLGINTRR